VDVLQDKSEAQHSISTTAAAALGADLSSVY
jgi:hypothetical protein